MALSSCSTIPTPKAKIPLIEYSKPFMQEAAKELPKAGVHVQTLVNDYGKVRNQIRELDRD